MKEPELNDFLKYLQKKCTSSAEHSRNGAIDKIKIIAEVKGCMENMMKELERRFPDKILDD